MKTYSQLKQLVKDLSIYIRYRKAKSGSDSEKKLEKLLEDKLITCNSLAERLGIEGFGPAEKRRYYFSPSQEYRIIHIAISEYRGKTRSQIENPENYKLLDQKSEKKILDLKEKMVLERAEFLAKKALTSEPTMS